MLLAAGGTWLGYPIVDPLIGFGIGIAILSISWDAMKAMWYRLMDAVEPELVDGIERAAATRYPAWKPSMTCAYAGSGIGSKPSYTSW